MNSSTTGRDLYCLARFRRPDGEASFGLLAAGDVIDLSGQLPLDDGSGHVSDMRELLAAIGTHAKRLDELVDPRVSELFRWSLDDVTLLAPVTPPHLLCVGLNYPDHAEEAGLKVPEFPDVFVKLGGSVIGTGEPILVPEFRCRIDFEGELAVVIGKGGRNIRQEDVHRHIAGFTVANDVTARDIQVRTGQWTLGKSIDGFGPIGPWIVAAEWDHVPDFDLCVRVNGEQVQQGSTARMFFSVEEIVEYISRYVTLAPGDVILTGTPAGVGAFRRPRLWLQSGDVVEVEVDGIGVLSNTVVGTAADGG